MNNKPRLLRITTIPISLKILLKGQLPFFSKHGFEVLAVSSPGREVGELRAEGISHQAVNMTRKITPIRDLICLIHLIQIILKFKPHIVHTHTPKAGLLGMMAAWLCRVPVRMHTVAGLPLMESHGLKKKVLIFTERITYACAHKVYPNSHGLKDYIHHELNINNALHVIGRGSSNGIDTGFFSRTVALENTASGIRGKHNILENDIVFCFVGRIVKSKGIEELTRAFQTNLAKNILPDRRLHLLLVGPFENDLDPPSQEVLDYLRKSPNVILAGFQSDVRPWIMASDIFVFPSHREGFPNVVMQAACLHVPAIVSDINGCNEIIQHGVTGFIVPSKNDVELANAMSLLMDDKVLRESFAKESQSYVKANFDQPFVWNELLHEYQNLLSINRNMP